MTKPRLIAANACVCMLVATAAGANTADSQQPSPFWSYWSDGKAELDGYDLVQPRYGEARHGRAVLVYVTEPYSRSKHVKVDRFNPKDPDHFTALKLNHVRKFQTGVYDYSLMTSVFVDPAQDFAPVKITFTAQEWCGHVFQELRFDGASIANRVDSYFEGESRSETLQAPKPFVSDDNLLISLRSLASGALQAEGRQITLLPGLTERRLAHRPLEFLEAELSWSEPKTRQVPAGSFEVREASVRRKDGRGCTYAVEVPYPHRIVGWACTDGEKAELTGSIRLAYWGTHREGDEKLLQQLGLRPLQVAP